MTSFQCSQSRFQIPTWRWESRGFRRRGRPRATRCGRIRFSCGRRGHTRPSASFNSVSTCSALTGRPAGIPSRTATSPRPWLSPAVVKRRLIKHAGPTGCRARLPWGVASPGPYPHLRRAVFTACSHQALELLMTGMATITRPQAVIPNKELVPRRALGHAQGPMIEVAEWNGADLPAVERVGFPEMEPSGWAAKMTRSFWLPAAALGRARRNRTARTCGCSSCPCRTRPSGPGR